VQNPADEVGPASIATFAPKDRSLSPSEIRVMLKQLEHVATLPTIRLGMRLWTCNGFVPVTYLIKVPRLRTRVADTAWI